MAKTSGGIIHGKLKLLEAKAKNRGYASGPTQKLSQTSTLTQKLSQKSKK
jgi:hypothetical protein